MPRYHDHRRPHAVALSRPHADGRIGSLLLATEVADHLVARGVPFRTAHEITGRIVRDLDQMGREFSSLSLTDWQQYDPRFDASILQALTPESAVAANERLSRPGRRPLSSGARRGAAVDHFSHFSMNFSIKRLACCGTMVSEQTPPDVLGSGLSEFAEESVARERDGAFPPFPSTSSDLAQESGHAVVDDFRQAADARRDDRHLAGHRLERRHAEALL